MENKPKTYQRSVDRIEMIIGTSGVLTLLAERARRRAEACNQAGGDGSEEWNEAFEKLRAMAAEMGKLLRE